MGIPNYNDEDIITSKCFNRSISNIELNCLINITATFQNDNKITIEFKKFSENSYFEE